MTYAEQVKAVQRKIGVAADGIVGPKTIAAAKKAGVALPAKAPATVGSKATVPDTQFSAKVKELQTKLGVKPDGIIGPKTRAAAQAKGIALPTATQIAAAVKLSPALTSPAVAVAAPIPAALLAPPVPALTLARSPDVSSLVAAIPPQAKAAAASSLQQLAQTPGITMSDVDRLIAALTATMAPQLTAIAETLKQKQVATQATGESNALIQETERWQGLDSQLNANSKNWEMNAERWADNARVQADILQQIKDIARRITAKDAATKRIYQAYNIPL